MQIYTYCYEAAPNKSIQEIISQVQDIIYKLRRLPKHLDPGPPPANLCEPHKSIVFEEGRPLIFPYCFVYLRYAIFIFCRGDPFYPPLRAVIMCIS